MGIVTPALISGFHLIIKNSQSQNNPYVKIAINACNKAFIAIFESGERGILRIFSSRQST